MPTSKGIRTVANTAAMQGPAQMTGIAEDVDARLPDSRPTVASLAQVTPLWVGRLMTVEADGSIRKYNGTSWDLVYLPKAYQDGTVNAATDANGDVKVDHSLGAVPIFAVFMNRTSVGTPGLRSMAFVSATATQATFRVYNTNSGNTLGNNPVFFQYRLYAI